MGQRSKVLATGHFFFDLSGEVEAHEVGRALAQMALAQLVGGQVSDKSVLSR
jgi:hypothetical protein